MSYYKVIRDGMVTDAGEMFLRWQEKHKIMLACKPEEAQFIQGSNGTILRVAWLNPAPEEAGTYETVEAALIDRQEYLDLRAVLDDGETVPEPEPVQPEPTPEPEPGPDVPEGEKPMTVQQMREKITEQDATIQMLTECLLEMSEVVYG